jgi:hypothetical protein
MGGLVVLLASGPRIAAGASLAATRAAQHDRVGETAQRLVRLGANQGGAVCTVKDEAFQPGAGRVISTSHLLAQSQLLARR